jgi:hypothetical protein
MFQLAYLVFSPIIGGNLQKIGRKTAIVSGYGIIVMATVGFGLLVYIRNDLGFMVASLLLRFF